MVGFDQTQNFFDIVKQKCNDENKQYERYIQAKENASVVITSCLQMVRTISKFGDDKKNKNKNKIQNRSTDRMFDYLCKNRGDYLGINILGLGQSNQYKSISKSWNDDDKYQFENTILLFIKDINKEILDLQNLLSLSIFVIFLYKKRNSNESSIMQQHNYFQYQKRVLICLKFSIDGLSSEMKSLIRSKMKFQHDLSSILGDAYAHTSLRGSAKTYVTNTEGCDMFIQEMLNDYKRKAYNMIEKKMNFFDDTKRLFLRESQQMLQAIESEKDEVLLAEQKTNEICSLLEMFTENITSQDTVIGTIESIVTQSADDLKTGNKELEKATERGRVTRSMFVILVVALTFSLLFLDWFKS
ncbi:syntaxin-18 [Reticulomyxa filosa]|uniref:Syntaxin-18 n=1 Tax=Reticulomyxa filosa TaxID=46433 RepID=X6P0W3_RETFI|nr:syntaxin-18 [Reticulomyxa filosa]|eukprot:ETO32205.1 syntaxin-18 [Reticulomyxa filosa]